MVTLQGEEALAFGSLKAISRCNVRSHDAT